MDTNDSFVPERDRGVLTETDRSFLLNREKYAENHTQQAVSRREQDVKDRTRNAIQDFEILLRCLEPDEVAEIFGEPGDYDDGTPVGEAIRSPGVEAILALWIASLYDRSLNVLGADAAVDIAVQRAVTQALESRGRELESYQSLQFNREPSLDELHERFKNDGGLSWDEFQRLLASDVVGDIRREAVIQRSALSEELDESAAEDD